MSPIGLFVIVVMFVMISRPFLFFDFLDWALEPKRYDITKNSVTNHHINPTTLVRFGPTDEGMEHDEETILKFDQIIEATENPEAKRIWNIKREQYCRDMRWKKVNERKERRDVLIVGGAPE